MHRLPSLVPPKADFPRLVPRGLILRLPSKSFSRVSSRRR